MDLKFIYDAIQKCRSFRLLNLFGSGEFKVDSGFKNEVQQKHFSILCSHMKPNKTSGSEGVLRRRAI